MKYVYPNNLMVRRSERRELIKGGILLTVFIVVIAGLFFASDYAHKYKVTSPILICNEGNPNSCRLE